MCKSMDDKEISVDSKATLKDWVLRSLFVFLYVVQVVGSIWFLRWAWTSAWNHESPITSGLFLLTEVVAFWSSTLFLFCGTLWIFRSSVNAPDETVLDELGVPLGNLSDGNSKSRHDSWIANRTSPTTNIEPMDHNPRSLGSLSTVAVCVCRYNEPLEDLLKTVECMNQLRWPGPKLQLFILDDGWYGKDDTYRQQQARELAELLVSVRTSPVFCTCPQTFRPDCATECTFWRIRNASAHAPEVTLVARKKPNVSHYKAGNVNNFLYNYLGHAAATGHQVPEYMLLLDHDMLPHPDLITDSIPSLRANSEVAFIQYPQRFYDIAGSDQLYAGNEIFFDGVQINRSLAGIAAFAGTNAVWNLQALYHVGGFQYGSLTEDASTGLAVNAMGYRSLYSEKELAVGQSPQTVEDAMQQRMRWSQGAIEIFLTYAKASICRRSALSYVDPPEELQREFEKDQPQAPSFARRIVMLIIYFDSMVYPLYSAGFLLHVLVALLYLYNAQAPMAPDDPIQLLYIWLPIYIVKAACQVLAFPRVSLTAQWNSQMAWAGYSISTLKSIGKAVCKSGNIWFNTGAARQKRFLTQYGNSVIGVLLYGMIIYRAVAFIAIDKTCSAWTTMGALMYGLVMIVHVCGWALMPFRRKGPYKEDEGSSLLQNSMSLAPSEQAGGSHRATEWHERARKASVQSREEYHSYDLSLLVVFFHVVLLSCFLFFWASLHCDGSGIVSSSNIEALPTPLLPPHTSVEAEFIAEDGQLLLNGKPFFVKGINWFGFETESNMAFGLQHAGQDTLMQYIVEQGFNSIRLPLAAESILAPALFRLDEYFLPVDMELNAHMDTSDYLTAVKSFVDRAASWGVFVLLDIHRLRNNKNTSPLPYDEETTFDDVKNAWSVLCKEFCSKWAVMGADLFNEPHGVTWGTGGATDWRLLAEDLSSVVSTACPRWLHFVEGMSEFSRTEDSPLTVPFTQWGSVVRPAKEFPIRVANQSKLVYSPHVYGPGTVGGLEIWNPNPCGDACLLCLCKENAQDPLCTTSDLSRVEIEELKNRTSSTCIALLPFSEQPYPENMDSVWDYIFGDLVDNGQTVVVGEWGGTYIDEATNSHPRLAVKGESLVREYEARWNQAFEAYLFRRGIGSFYWCLNPESDDTGGLLVDWKTANTAKEALLRRSLTTDPLSVLFPSTTEKTELEKCLEEAGIDALKEGSAYYEAQAKTNNMALDEDRNRPLAIVFPQSEDTVALAVTCAACSAFPLCVRSGGNSYTGDSSCDGLLLDVRNLRRFERVDDGPLYWIGTGLTTGELTTMLSEQNRLIPVGGHGRVAMGFYFGCGRGRLSRNFGLGCDSIVAARIVTATGEVIEAWDDNEHSELLWAIRGSGASHFGVVTSVLMETQSTTIVEPATTFRLVWPRNKTADAIRVWQDWAPSHANFAFSCDLVLFNAIERMEGVNFECGLFGDEEEVDVLFAPVIERLGPPMESSVEKSSYLEYIASRMGVDSVLAIRNPYGGFYGERHAFLNKAHIMQKPLEQSAIDELVKFANAEVPGTRPYNNYVQFMGFGGAIAESPRPNCFSHRSALAVIEYGGYWDDSVSRETMVFHQRRIHGAMSKYLGQSSFYNYKDNGITTNWEDAYWGNENAQRLASLKCLVDPQNLFSSAQQSLRCTAV